MCGAADVAAPYAAPAEFSLSHAGVGEHKLHLFRSVRLNCPIRRNWRGFREEFSLRVRPWRALPWLGDVSDIPEPELLVVRGPLVEGQV